MITSIQLSLRLWFSTCIVLGIGFVVFAIYNAQVEMVAYALLAFLASLVCSLPALVVLLIALPFIKKFARSTQTKWQLFSLLIFLTCLPYGLVAAIADSSSFDGFNWEKALETAGLITGALLVCNTIAAIFNYQKIASWIQNKPVELYQPEDDSITATNIEPAESTEDNATQEAHSADLENENLFNQNQIPTTMIHEDATSNQPSSNSYNKTLIKAVITAVLILAMLIPTAFITRLVEERKERQKEVVAEVSSKWATAQTISTPYLFIPYNDVVVNDSNKTTTLRKHIIVLADKLSVTNDLKTEQRSRSIYNVLLYRSAIKMNGNFKITLPKDINPANLFLSEAKVCVGISDFKGIEEKLTITVGDTAFDLQPGLPVNSIDDAGLSVPITLTEEVFTKPLNFSIGMKIKGSEQLHFIPLSANSDFTIRSDWHSPSFDGNSLPQEHTVSDSGFTAKWSFNQANLPFPTVIKKSEIKANSISFGVSLVQAADQYSKTMRSVKYAILFIGLTFGLFFILELSQRKQVHPVQYILIGIALVIFYTLLLSIGEFTGFNIAYLLASVATITLVGLYTKSLFDSIKTSLLLTAFLSLLYGFIYVLIQLEDTALLAGSIGLFVLLATAMYYSRRINWYGNNKATELVP